MSDQLSFDFDAVVAPRSRPSAKTLKAEAKAQAEDDRVRNLLRRQAQIEEARAYWRIGMVTSLPCFATVLDSEQRYTQMLPGVVEAIADDRASVRIYAAPEYGYTIDEYLLHKKLAVDVPLTELGFPHFHSELVRIVEAGALATGDPELAAKIRARQGHRRWPA